MPKHTNATHAHYIGRFAPSPTGPLHFGSLVSALASYLDAKQNHGEWLVRIEDVDGTRCKPEYTQQILTTLESYQLISDEEIEQQSDQHQEYEHHLAILKSQNVVFPCNCTRQALTPYRGSHPTICQSNTEQPHSWRLKTSATVYQYKDDIQGMLEFKEDLKNNCPVLKRKDGYFSYQLAVVVDDHRQNITHLVRGADLIETTAQQLHLYNLFGWSAPKIQHIPLIVNASGDKISKQNHAPAIKNADLHTLKRALHYLGISIDNTSNIQQTLTLAIENWQPQRLANQTQLFIEEKDMHLI